MPFRPPLIQSETQRLLRYQHKVNPRSLDLRHPDLVPERRGMLPETMTNPQYWPDGTTTHIFPPDDNPTRMQGIQAIAQMLGLGDRLQGRR